MPCFLYYTYVENGALSSDRAKMSQSYSDDLYSNSLEQAEKIIQRAYPERGQITIMSVENI